MVASPRCRFNGPLQAFNAPVCSSPGSPLSNCSHRPHLSGQAREPEDLRAVALLPWCYLSSLACATGFFYTPVSPSKHPEFLCKPLALKPLLPPLPHFGSTVKAVTPWLSFSFFGSLSSLSLRGS